MGAKEKHGEANQPTPEYTLWTNMIQRCENRNHHKFSAYGARGISIHREWRSSFPAFLAYVGRRPSRFHSLDRYPNKDGNYEPGNIRWATAKEQSQNSSAPRIIEAGGIRLNESEWAARLGVAKCSIANRIFRGMTPEEAVTKPFRSPRYKRAA